MEEFVFSTSIVIYALVTAFGAAMAIFPDSHSVRCAGIFTAVAMGFVTLMTASEEVINWLVLR